MLDVYRLILEYKTDILVKNILLQSQSSSQTFLFWLFGCWDNNNVKLKSQTWKKQLLYVLNAFRGLLNPLKCVHAIGVRGQEHAPKVNFYYTHYLHTVHHCVL